jgi:hypothetical protein
VTIGVSLLVILAIPTLAQVIVQGIQRRKEHYELLERLDRLEAMLGKGAGG